MDSYSLQTATLSGTTPSPVLKSSQQSLEQNEDMIASITESLQMGRIRDCIPQFSTLMNNLISLSLEYDNYPIQNENDDFPRFINEFQDRLMRKDNLDEFLPPQSLFKPPPPPIPACKRCSIANVSYLLFNDKHLPDNLLS